MLMTLKEVQTLLDGELLTKGLDLEIPIDKVFASDMMSDVLAFMDPGSILLTGLVTPHVVRTAGLADVMAIVVVQGKKPAPEVVAEAMRISVPIISTVCSMFEACSRISRSFPETVR
jgi:predicted transcriptional regulator